MPGSPKSFKRVFTVLPGALAVMLVACQQAPALPDPLEAGWQGAPVCENLHENRLQRVLRCTFPPGVGHERHFHRPHTGYAIAGGRMQITDASGTREASPPTGATFVSDGVQWHEVINVGDTTAVFLIVEDKR